MLSLQHGKMPFGRVLNRTLHAGTVLVPIGSKLLKATVSASIMAFSLQCTQDGW